MPHFAAGVMRFQNDAYSEKKDLLENLSKGQSPEALFITCSDSRTKTGSVGAFDDHKNAFVPVDDRYTDELANLPANRHDLTA